SDSVKLPFEIYYSIWLPVVGKTIEEPCETSDFQAEYEGSIPFTRSSVRSRSERGLPRRSPWGEGRLWPRATARQATRHRESAMWPNLTVLRYPARPCDYCQAIQVLPKEPICFVCTQFR